MSVANVSPGASRLRLSEFDNEKHVCKKLSTNKLTLNLIYSVKKIINTTSFFTHFTGSRALDPSEVSIKGCTSGICKLKRKTNAEIQLKIVPEKNSESRVCDKKLVRLQLKSNLYKLLLVNKLTTSVQAVINNLPFPFIGVDGTSACNNMFDEAGNKVSCPLVKGKTYIYKNSFPVLEIYPKIQLLVHWALKEGNRDLSCFEVHARIV